MATNEPATASWKTLRVALRSLDVAAVQRLLDEGDLRAAGAGVVAVRDGALVVAEGGTTLSKRSQRRRANRALVLARALGLLDGVTNLVLAPAPDQLAALGGLPALRQVTLHDGWRTASGDASLPTGFEVLRTGEARRLSASVDLPPEQKRVLLAMRRAVRRLHPGALRALVADPVVARRLEGAVRVEGARLAVDLRHAEIARALPGEKPTRPSRSERLRRGLVLAAALGLLDRVEGLLLEAWEPHLLRACAPSLRTLVLTGGFEGEVATRHLPRRLSRITLLEGRARVEARWLAGLLALPRLQELVRVGSRLPLAPLVDAIALRRAEDPRARLPLVVWNDPALSRGSVSWSAARGALGAVRYALSDGSLPADDVLLGRTLPLGHDAQSVVLRGVRGLRDLHDLAPLRDLRRLDVERCAALRALDGVPVEGALREARVIGCAALEDVAALAQVESVTLTSPPARLGAGVRRLMLLAPEGRLGEVPLPRGLTHLTLRGFRAITSVAELRPLAALTDLRVLDLTACEGLPGPDRRVVRGAEIRVLLGVWTTPAAVARRRDGILALRDRPEGIHALRPETRRCLETLSAADVQRAEANLADPPALRSLQLDDDLACVAAFAAAMEDWRRCFARALAREGKVPPRDREDLLEMAVFDLWRQATGDPELAEWPVAHASSLASLRTSLLFHMAAKERVLQWRRQLGTKGPLFYSNVVALPGKEGRRATAQIHKEWEAPHADAAEVGVEDPEHGGARLLRRRSTAWRGDLGAWTWTLPMIEAFRALAPIWLPKPSARGESATSRADGRAPGVSLRTLATMQRLPHTVSSRARAYIEQPLGPPIADLDDEVLATRAWGQLRREERAGAERLRLRALGVLQSALDGATADTREAWNAAVSLERRIAHGDTVEVASDGDRENAWLAVFEGRASLHDARRAGAARRDSEGAAKEIWTSTFGDTLMAALLGREHSSSGSLPSPWEASDLRALLAWCRAWARGGARAKGLRFRDTEALVQALDDALVVQAASEPGGVRNLVVLAAMAAQGEEAAHPDIAARVDRARARVASLPAAQVWSQVARSATRSASPARRSPEERLLAASLDALELLVAARWLQEEAQAGDATPAEEVLGALGHLAAASPPAARDRARRALQLVAVRFPGALDEAHALVNLVLGASSPPIAPMLALALGQPILTEVSSTAYAEDGDASRLRALGWTGAAAEAWLGGDRVVLYGAGWEIPGLELPTLDAGTRLARREMRLPEGTWTLRREGTVIARIVVRG